MDTPRRVYSGADPGTALHDRLLPAWFGIILCVLGPIIVAAAVRSHRIINHSVKVKVGPSPDPRS